MTQHAQPPEIVSADPHQPELPGPARALQWVGMFLAAGAFLVHLQANYLVVLYVCGTTLGRVPVYATNLIAIAIAAVGLWAALVTWRRGRSNDPGDGDGALPRTRLLGALGLGMSALFILLLVAQLVASLVVPTCH
jgi:hypothetical protein